MRKMYFRLGRILSEGKGRQLVWLIGILVVVLFLISAIVRTFFANDGIGTSNILALFFGVDSLNDTSGVQTVIMLIIALIGTLLFSTFLISVITNIVDNISESYRVGKIHIKLSEHTVFLGANHLLIGMLRELSRTGKTGEILILTTSNVEELRDPDIRFLNPQSLTIPLSLPFAYIFFQFRQHHNICTLASSCALSQSTCWQQIVLIYRTIAVYQQYVQSCFHPPMLIGVIQYDDINICCFGIRNEVIDTFPSVCIYSNGHIRKLLLHLVGFITDISCCRL